MSEARRRSQAIPSATLNGEVARQREIETSRRAEQRAPLLAALAASRRPRRGDPLATPAPGAARERNASPLAAVGRALGRMTRRAGRSLGSS